MPWSRLSKFLERKSHRQQSFREESIDPTRNAKTSTKTTIIVPLYIYPAPGAWDRLYESIEQHSKTHFLVIVNPGNGPGPNAIPDENYLREIPRLSAYANVDVVGYVHTTFGRRELAAVLSDIETYSRWSEQTQYPGLGINGIFVDETSNQYDVDTEKSLGHLTEFAKNCSGFGGNKLVIHNPGCAPPPAYMALADLTVVFEDTWQTFVNRHEDGVFDLHTLFGAACVGQHEKLVIMIHSIPRHLHSDAAKDFVKLAKQTANVMFITDLSVNYYSNWSSRWADWVNMVASQ